MNKLFLVLIGLTTLCNHAQTKEIDSLLSTIENTPDAFESAKINLQLAKLHERIDLKKGMQFAYKALRYQENDSIAAEANNQLGRFHFFGNQLDSATVYFENARTILQQLNDHERAAIINISLGAIYLREGNYQKTISTLTESASFFEDTKDDLNAAKCYSNISSAFAELENYDKAIEYSEKALHIFETKKQRPFELITLPNLAVQYFKKGDTLKAIEIYNKTETLAKEMNNKRSLSVVYNNLGNIYLDSDYNKAKTYLENALQLKNELNLQAGREITESNLGYIYLKTQQYSKAINLLENALPNVNGKQRVFVLNNLKDAYVAQQNMDYALKYLEEAQSLNDSLLSAENQESILDIQTQYETEKKEKEILQLKNDNLEANYKRRQNLYLLIGALVALGLAILGIYLLRKNARRKRIILEQKHTIISQEFEQLLNQQKLEGIDAILDAQEEERSKLASDLHDNLGSKVATLKLYLESYDRKDDFTSFYNKLKDLMSDTYNEIRSITKSKNFGTQIDKGLVPSTKKIAKQISGTKKIDIKVIHVDVNHRIENTVEIQVFRIIQELITNIIKHSGATEAVIQFTEQDDTLNIVVEDNGTGFDITTKKSGIGLINIEKRMEKIDGELVIDTSPGNGTTVILNIPI